MAILVLRDNHLRISPVVLVQRSNAISCTVCGYDTLTQPSTGVASQIVPDLVKTDSMEAHRRACYTRLYIFNYFMPTQCRAGVFPIKH